MSRQAKSRGLLKDILAKVGAKRKEEEQFVFQKMDEFFDTL